MAGRTLKDRLRARDHLVGTYAFLPCPDSAEIAAMAGADFVIIDLEHSPKDWSIVAGMIRAVQGRGSYAVVRLPGTREPDTGRIADMSPDGLMVPGIRDEHDVVQLVRSAMLPPQGKRGSCGMTRAAAYGVDGTDFLDVARRMNSNLALIGIVEHRIGISNILQIAAVPNGLDGIEIGRRDLAGSLDPPCDIESEQVEAKVREGAELVREAGISLGLLLRTVDDIPRWAALGANLFTFSSDVQVLGGAYEHAFRKIRQVVSVPS